MVWDPLDGGTHGTSQKADYFLRNVKDRFEYKEDEKFMLPDERKIPDELYKKDVNIMLWKDNTIII